MKECCVKCKTENLELYPSGCLMMLMCECHKESPHSSTEIENWEPQFKKFLVMTNEGPSDFIDDVIVPGTTVKDIEDFIRETLAQERIKVLEEVATLPKYEVTDDVKNQEGKWVEFSEIEVIKISDIQNILLNK